MLGLRQKLMFGFGGLVILIAGIGLLTMAKVSDLGRSIDVILRENYRSVIACQDMKEALERVDSAVLLSLIGRTEESRRIIEENREVFERALKTELSNITLPAEGEKARRISDVFKVYVDAIAPVVNEAASATDRRRLYMENVYPLFNEIKRSAQEILELNQQNMVQANDRARAQAAAAHRQLLLVILASAAIAIIYALFIRRWILLPIRRLISFTDEARRGNLDLVLRPEGHDEIGRLAESFNDMAEGLREIRRKDKQEVFRTRRVTEEVFKALPTPIAVLDLQANVELSTEPAERLFGLKPGVNIRTMGEDWLTALVDRALTENQTVEYFENRGGVIQKFDGPEERLFHPVALPLSLGGSSDEPSALAVLILDVTHIYEQLELKRSVVATVSHQLKTPLTALRMSLHLLLDESQGELNPGQTELILAARDESERLVRIVNDLLDIDRIESGRAQMVLKSEDPAALIRATSDRHYSEARNQGIALTISIPPNLPRVMADRSRISLVFDNLLSNALRFTEPGGTIRIEAEAAEKFVRFAVRDTGRGIPPEYVSKVFTPFFRAPGQNPSSGVGLGLAIVRETVRHHGGTSGVNSDLGKETVVWFTLPQDDQVLP